jgi:hypothetical protein
MPRTSPRHVTPQQKMWFEVAKLNAIMFRLSGVTERHIAVRMTILAVPSRKGMTMRLLTTGRMAAIVALTTMCMNCGGGSSSFDDVLHHRFGDRVARYCPDFSLLCLRQSRLSDYGYSRRDFVFYLFNGRLHFGVVGIVIGDNSYLAQHGFQLTQIR